MNVRNQIRRGFTMMEFMLVVAISSILILGLSALIEVPRRVTEQEVAGSPRISSLDRAIAQLDRDIRFATDVERPSPTHLRITRKDASVVEYTWAGGSAPFVRTVGARSTDLIPIAMRAVFALQSTEIAVDASDDGSLAASDVETAGFETFSLNAGYALPSERTRFTTVVSVNTSTAQIGSGMVGGVYFKASGLSDDAGSAAAIRLRLRRRGTDDLKLRIYEADALAKEPNRTRPVAYAHVLNSALPTALSDVTIRLTSVSQLTQNTAYFIELSSAGTGDAADLEVQSLSDADAAAASNGGFLLSSDGGSSFSALSTSLDASQTVFDLTVRKTSAVAPVDGVAATDQIPTAVRLRISLPSTIGSVDMDVSFPVANNLARVNG